LRTSTGALFREAAFEPAVPPIELLRFLAPGEFYGAGVDDDDVIARVDERGIDRSMLTLQQASSHRRDAAQNLASRVNDVPPAVRAFCAGYERTHEKGILACAPPAIDGTRLARANPSRPGSVRA
jgi:hypothetical protein